MKSIELLEKNPQCSKLICSYYLEIMLESLNDDSLPEDFKAHVREQGIDDDKIAAIIDGNPRNLFDFFDQQDIIISITYNRANNKFCYFVNTQGNKPEFDTRKEADKHAIELAIVLLEEKLNSLEKTN